MRTHTDGFLHPVVEAIEGAFAVACAFLRTGLAKRQLRWAGQIGKDQEGRSSFSQSLCRRSRTVQAKSADRFRSALFVVFCIALL